MTLTVPPYPTFVPQTRRRRYFENVQDIKKRKQSTPRKKKGGKPRTAAQALADKEQAAMNQGQGRPRWLLPQERTRTLERNDVHLARALIGFWWVSSAGPVDHILGGTGARRGVAMSNVCLARNAVSNTPPRHFVKTT